MNFLPAVLWLMFCKYMMIQHPDLKLDFGMSGFAGTMFAVCAAIYQTERQRKDK